MNHEEMMNRWMVFERRYDHLLREGPVAAVDREWDIGREDFDAHRFCGLEDGLGRWRLRRQIVLDIHLDVFEIVLDVNLVVSDVVIFNIKRVFVKERAVILLRDRLAIFDVNLCVHDAEIRSWGLCRHVRRERTNSQGHRYVDVPIRQSLVLFEEIVNVRMIRREHIAQQIHHHGMSLRQGLPPHVIFKYVRMIKVNDGEVVVWDFPGNEVLIESRMIVRQTIRGIQETIISIEER